MEYILGKRKSDQFPLILSDEERRKHLYVIGATGMGKSAFVYSLIRADAMRGRGFALLDPHQELAERVADALPPERIEHSIFFDPLADTVVTYNPIKNYPRLKRATATSHIVTSFRHIWGEISWGPRLEYIFANSVRLLFENPQYTLVDIPRLLTDKNFRTPLIKNCKDPRVQDFWKYEFDAWTEKYRNDAIGAVQNKVGVFATNPYLRDIVGQPSTLDIPFALNNDKHLFFNLSSEMGEDVSAILGSLVVTDFSQSAKARASIPEEERKDFTLYADEFQHFASQSFATILSEARKFRLSLVLLHQYLGQLPLALQDAVIANAATIVAFRLGPKDADLLAPLFGVPVRELVNLPPYTAYVRYGQGVELIETLPPVPVSGSLPSVRRWTERRHSRERM